MVDDDLGNLPHHGEICQPRTMADMAIFGWIPRSHQPEPLKEEVLDESRLAGLCKKLLFQRGVDGLLHLSCQIIRSSHQQQMMVAMAIDDGLTLTLHQTYLLFW